MTYWKAGRVRKKLETRFTRGRRRIQAQSAIWIPVTAFALATAFWIAAMIRIHDEAKQARDTATAATIELAGAFAAHVAKTVHDADMVVRWVKFEYERSPATFDLATYQARGLVTADTALQVTIIGPNGEVLQTTTPDAKPENLRDRQHFIVHRSLPDVGLYISPPVLGRLSHRWTLQFTRRLNRSDGSFAGVVVVSEDSAYLTQGFYKLDLLGTGGMLAVTSDNGYLLSRLASGKPASPTGPPTSAFHGMTDAQGGLFVDPVDHVSRFVTYRHLQQYPVAVMVGLAADRQPSGYAYARKWYFLMAGIVSVVLMLAVGLNTMMMLKLVTGREQMRRLAGRMQYLAETDPLTSLPNRYQLREILRRRIERGHSIDSLALLFIDLDNFKRINDAMGHEAGDELLQSVARRLAQAAGSDCLLARVGGDEFVVLIDGKDAVAVAQNTARSIIDAFESAFGLRGSSYVIPVSIGIACYSDSADTEYDLLRQGDLAMYAAKADCEPSSTSRCRVYTAELAEHARRGAERQQELQYAIRDKEFFLEYQPIVSLNTRELHGVEALVRWRHPRGRTIMPAEFIPLAERTGCIVPIGEIVLELACDQFSKWRQSGEQPAYLSVNVSAAQLAHGDLVRIVNRYLKQYMIESDRLQLEITETAMLEESAVVKRQLKELRLAGVKVVLDDFCTGYSSLSQLTSLVVDGVKIDRSFTRGVPDDAACVATLSSIAMLTRELGLSLTVEGVETEQQLNWLRSLGDINVQGSYFSRPVPPAGLPLV